jgi:hypothetical protein
LYADECENYLTNVNGTKLILEEEQENGRTVRLCPFL